MFQFFLNQSHEVFRFFWNLRHDVFRLGAEHLWLVGTSMLLAIAIGVPVGIFLTRRPGWKNLVLAFPRAFRRHLGAFALSVGITLLGVAFGWFALWRDPQSKTVLTPFPHLMGSPADRVDIIPQKS